ncbi:MAG: DUF1553 domain-containing protein [Planctomycetes bacterium]|nr:DUF1553 domain-containing protein [Planctomycetota bacterium]
MDSDQPRSKIYTKILRNRRDALLDAFDAPDNFNSTSERNVTTTPTQSLLMINGPWTLSRARALASRLQRGQAADEKQTVTQAYRLVYGRKPNSSEVAAATAFLRDQAKRATPKIGDKTVSTDPRTAALIDFCHVLLNSSEFLYVD